MAAITAGTSETPRRPRAAPGWLLLAALLSGCGALVPFGGAETPPGAWGRRTVAERVDPDEVVATDGARCRVSADKYADIRPGDKVWCVWQRGALPADGKGPRPPTPEGD